MPSPTHIAVCSVCGWERERAEFYGEEGCRGTDQPDGYPGPIVGEHTWVLIDPPAAPLTAPLGFDDKEDFMWSPNDGATEDEREKSA